MLDWDLLEYSNAEGYENVVDFATSNEWLWPKKAGEFIKENTSLVTFNANKLRNVAELVCYHINKLTIDFRFMRKQKIIRWKRSNLLHMNYIRSSTVLNRWLDGENLRLNGVYK
jgi:hypothetical protein